jgi:large subunit ribosomal protein L54
MQAANPDMLTPKVPLHEQTIDLPAGDPLEAGKALKELTQTMRRARRLGIKENNYLKGLK